MDICMEIYEDVASGNEIRSVVQVRDLAAWCADLV